MGKTKATDYFTAGITLILLAGIIWLIEHFVLNGKVDNNILFIVPSVLVMLSIGHLVVAGVKMYSSLVG